MIEKCFDDTDSFLSNFTSSPIVVKTNDKTYNASSVDHAYQIIDNMILRERIATLEKLMGKNGSSDVRTYDAERLNIMRNLIREKFTQYPELGKQLIATGGNILMYTGDRFWGVQDDDGVNWLGNILMEIRRELHDNIRK